MFHVYILKSEKSNKSYVGSTSKEVERRLEEHDIGANKWTKVNRPFKLIYYESFICKQDALLRERFFKSGVGKRLKKLIIENY